MEADLVSTQRENERKFILSADFFAVLVDAPAFLGWAAERHQEHQVNHLFDTDDQVLRRNRFNLRARSTQGSPLIEWTAKAKVAPSSVTGLRQADETVVWKIESEDMRNMLTDAWETAPVQMARAIASDRTLREVAVYYTDRTSYQITPRGAAGHIEVAIDRVTTNDPEYVDYELELEDKGAGCAALETFANTLASAMNLEPSRRGKRGRVLRAEIERAERERKGSLTRSAA
jgi:inorganic triphosphatase YgiF